MPTKISYAIETLNPWVGCTKIRTGCLNCYAERCGYRLAAMGQENYKKVLDGRKWNGKIAYQLEQLKKLKHWHKPRRIFMGSMTDIFHEKVPFCEIVRVFDAMYDTGWHIYLVTTKRPDRALEFARWLEVTDKPKDKWMENLWLGISCSTQKDLDEMWPIAAQIPAANYWVSFEPLIEPIDASRFVLPQFEDITGLFAKGHKQVGKWVVIGCESGTHRRPCKIGWVRSIAEQCKAAGVAVFVKQLAFNDIVVTDPKDFPEDLRIREMPK